MKTYSFSIHYCRLTIVKHVLLSLLLVLTAAGFAVPAAAQGVRLKSWILPASADRAALAVAISPDGNRIVAGRGRAWIAGWDAAGDAERFRVYLGADPRDAVNAMAVDEDGYIYAAGSTVINGVERGFYAVLDAKGDSVEFQSLPAPAYALAVDAAGEVYLAGDNFVMQVDGWTIVPPGPVRALALTFDGTLLAAGRKADGSQSGATAFDAYVAHLSDAGDRWDWIRAIGGAGLDEARALAVDEDGAIYVSGVTGSINFPVKNAYQSRLNGQQNAFLAKLLPDNQGIEWATYLGGRGVDSSTAMAMDPSGNLLLVGSTNSSDFPMASGWRGAEDGFFARFDTSGHLMESSYFGSSGLDRLSAIAIERNGRAILAGSTNEGVEQVLLVAVEPFSAHLAEAASAPIVRMFGQSAASNSERQAGSTVTSTVLSSPQNSSVFGNQVILTATVTPAAATGTVTFYDGTTVLGVATLSGGTASRSTILLPTGARSLWAYYAGDTTYNVSTSATLPQVVNAYASINFNAAALSPFSTGQFPQAQAVGDFNGDGRMDVAVANYGSENITLYLGNGSGGFTEASGSPVASGATPYSIAVADFDGDGKADLAVTNIFSNTVTVLLGNGSGGFTAAAGSPFATGTSAISVAAGDFNRDGKADLAIANFDSGTITVLLGNGSGGFSPAPGSPFAAGTHPWTIVVGDFNGDGKPDMAVANAVASGVVTVLLGNGSGGFAAAAGSPYAVGSYPRTLAVGDIDGDGKLDLAVANNGSSNITVLMGNGSGGFTPAAGSPVTVGVQPSGISISDFNGDGKADLAVANGYSNDVSILLGNGSGSFTAAPGSPFATAGVQPTSIAAGDFSGDGRADLAISNYFSNNLTLLLGVGATPTAIAAFGGTPQSVQISQPFATALQAKVTDVSGNPIPGVRVTFTSPNSGAVAIFPQGNSALTNALGIASVMATANASVGGYNVTASVSGLATTASFSLTNLANTFTISGQVTGAAGVTVTLSGSSSASTVTNGTGNYSFAALAAGGTFTVTPSLAGYSFTPPAATLNNLQANQTANFTAAALTYTISGQVTKAGAALAGVTVTLTGGPGGTRTTDASGNYSFTALPYGGNYTVTPSLTGNSFTPASTAFTSLQANQTANFAAGTLTYTISGQVTKAGAALAGVTVTLTGGPGGTSTTDASGGYSFTALPYGGNYTVTPSLAGNSFTPASTAFTSLQANQTANFTATTLTYTITGQVTKAGAVLAGVTVTLTGGPGGTSTTDASGGYSFTALPYGGNYTVTPSLAGNSFTPASTAFTSLQANQTANFAAATLTYTISGQVTKGGGALAGVTVTLTGGPGGTVTTDASGSYSFTALAYGGNYTVTPSLAGNSFAPPSTAFTSLQANQTANFAAATLTYTISGQVTKGGGALAGVTVTLTGGTSGTVTTDASGSYSFTALPYGGNYTVTPSLAGNSFTPASTAFTSLQANQTANFAAATLSYTISGQVTKAGAALAGVTVTLTGGPGGTITTDAAGGYSFTALPYGGNYTVTPSLAGNSFTPASTAFTSLQANQTANFAATTLTYTISGQVTKAGAALAGVTVTLTGGSTGTRTTDAAGGYSFTALPYGGNYTVTASLAGNSFTPASTAFTTLQANQTANFAAATLTYTISGQATKGGAALVGVTMTLTGGPGGTITTDGSGSYSFTALPYGGNYTVTPTLTGNIFTPPATSFNNLQANQTASFTADSLTYSISGQVTKAGAGLSGVMLTLTGGSGGTRTTDGTGGYSFTGLTAGVSYIVTASFAGNSFAPANASFTNLQANQTANFAADTLTYTISGQVTKGGAGLAGVTVTLTGSTGGARTTDASGGYSFTALPYGGNYTVTPSLAGNSFTPSSATFNSIQANQTANFSADSLTYSISGQVTKGGAALAGVTVTLTGGTGGMRTTDASGGYSFTALPYGGNYTVTPSLAGNSFTAASATFNSIQANQTANFSADSLTYSISGLVTKGGAALAGVTVTLTGSTGGTRTTDASGGYSFTALPFGGNYTVTASLAGNSFTPSNATFNSIQANQTANFSADSLTYSISGQVTKGGAALAGVTVTLTGGTGGMRTTDASGGYSFTALPYGGNYTVTPSLTGNSFTPASATFNSIQANQTANFTTDSLTYSISGQVTKGGAALAGVTVTLTGPAGGTRTTDASGGYSFTALPFGGSYTVTASLAGNSFTPSSTTFNSIQASQTANFTAATLLYSVSGQVTKGGAALSGVTVTLSGNSSGVLTTDGSGGYSFIGLAAGGTYTVTPSLAGNSFTPSSATLVSLQANQTANFTATSLTYTISGHLIKGGAALAGATVTLTGGIGGTVLTDGAGGYSFANLTAGVNYTVTPSMAGNTFAPTSATFNNLLANQTADFTATSTAVTSLGIDINGDGKSDVLWQNPSTGDLWAWFMNGTATTGTAAINGATTWRVPGVADFNGDGKPDILWQNPANGELWVWFMNGSSQIGAAPVAGATTWRIVGTGDFNGDGKPDILWQEPTTGDLWVWYMNGSTMTGSAPLGGATSWKVVGAADINGDGKQDILWQNPATGDLWVWYMNGTAQIGAAPLGGATSWKVVGTGDYNGDGKVDILWQQPVTGDLWAIFMNGSAQIGSTPLGGSTTWKAFGAR
jgi:hypothetical protein